MSIIFEMPLLSLSVREMKAKINVSARMKNTRCGIPVSRFGILINNRKLAMHNGKSGIYGRTDPGNAYSNSTSTAESRAEA